MIIDPDRFLETPEGRLWTPERDRDAWAAAFEALETTLAATPPPRPGDRRVRDPGGGQEHLGRPGGPTATGRHHLRRRPARSPTPGADRHGRPTLARAGRRRLDRHAPGARFSAMPLGQPTGSCRRPPCAASPSASSRPASRNASTPSSRSALEPSGRASARRSSAPKPASTRRPEALA